MIASPVDKKLIDDYVLYPLDIDERPDEQDSFMMHLEKGYLLYGFPFECRGVPYQALIKYKEETV